MSQPPYQPAPSGQPEQSGQPPQPAGYPAPGYSAGGYPPPGQPPYGGGYPGGPGGASPSPFSGGAGPTANPLTTPEGLAPILQIVAGVIAVLGVIGAFFAFSGYGSGSGKFFEFTVAIVAALGFSGVLQALSVLLRTKSSTNSSR